MCVGAGAGTGMGAGEVGVGVVSPPSLEFLNKFFDNVFASWGVSTPSKSPDLRFYP